MGLTNEQLSELFCKQLTEADVASLDLHGIEDSTLQVLGLEHVSRSASLLRASSDLVAGRSLLLIAARHLLDEAHKLNDTLRKDPTLELVE